MTAIDFSKKSLVFITGASRGIGRALAVGISALSHSKSSLILIASSARGLKETKSKISKVNIDLNVITFPLDLSSPSSEDFEKLFDSVLKQTDVSELENSVIIHNAGTVGVLKKALELTDVNIWRNFFELNVTGAFVLNSIFIRKNQGLCSKLTVINISSKCGLVPFHDMSMYCSAKAAREMYFKVVALEQPDVTVLNYSPGPVDTDMFHSIIETAQDEEVRENFKKAKETVMLQPKQTVDMFLSILEKGDFKSGDSIDYFDRV